MKQKEIIFQKIFLESFIDVLMNIYERGADFIDLVGCPDNLQDRIEIYVREEYIRQEDKELTREDINDLLNG